MARGNHADSVFSDEEDRRCSMATPDGGGAGVGAAAGDDGDVTPGGRAVGHGAPHAGETSSQSGKASAGPQSGGPPGSAGGAGPSGGAMLRSPGIILGLTPLRVNNVSNSLLV